MRKENGITQKELAKLIGVSPLTISRVENGNIKTISPKVLFGYAYVLNGSLDRLFDSDRVFKDGDMINIPADAVDFGAISSIISLLSKEGQKTLSDCLYKIENAILDKMNPYTQKRKG